MCRCPLKVAPKFSDGLWGCRAVKLPLKEVKSPCLLFVLSSTTRELVALTSASYLNKHSLRYYQNTGYTGGSP